MYELNLPQTKLEGILVSSCPSVCLSPSVNMILSTRVLRNGCMDFSENMYTYYLPSKDMHREFSW